METLTQWTMGQGLSCPFQPITGLYYPGYGGTRAVRTLFHGGLRVSSRYHSLILYTVLVLTVELVSSALSRALKDPR